MAATQNPTARERATGSSTLTTAAAEPEDWDGRTISKLRISARDPVLPAEEERVKVGRNAAKTLGELDAVTSELATSEPAPTIRVANLWATLSTVTVT
jgi:hypothetical protein